MISIRPTDFRPYEGRSLLKKQVRWVTKDLSPLSGAPSREVINHYSPVFWSSRERIVASNLDRSSDALFHELHRQVDNPNLEREVVQWSEEIVMSSNSPVGRDLIPSTKRPLWRESGPITLDRSKPMTMYSSWERRDSRPDWEHGIELCSTTIPIDYKTGLMKVENLRLLGSDGTMMWTSSLLARPEDFA